MNSNSLSEKERELTKELISIWKDKEFVLGIICTLKSDAEVQNILDYIRAKEWETPSDITAEALIIASKRK